MPSTSGHPNPLHAGTAAWCRRPHSWRPVLIRSKGAAHVAMSTFSSHSCIAIGTSASTHHLCQLHSKLAPVTQASRA